MPDPNALMNDVAMLVPYDRHDRAARTILWGALIAGALDISAALITWMLKGVAATRILQSIASGLLGRDAHGGGGWSAALGLLLHFVIMSGIVAVFYLASRKLPILTERWFACGVVYGIAVYIVMSFVVLPLSAYPGRLLPGPSMLIQGVLVHIVCVGLPIAFITRRVSQVAHFAGE